MKRVYTTTKELIAVKVQRIDNRSYRYRVIPGSICCMKIGTSIMERPDALILDDCENKIQTSGEIFWSAETIDPYHLVTIVHPNDIKYFIIQ